MSVRTLSVSLTFITVKREDYFGSLICTLLWKWAGHSPDTCNVELLPNVIIGILQKLAHSHFVISSASTKWVTAGSSKHFYFYNDLMDTPFSYIFCITVLHRNRK